MNEIELNAVRFCTAENGNVLALLKSDALGHRAFENLVLLNPVGEVLWRAELPERSSDYYVAFDWYEGRLFANSWSCYRVEISLETGKIIAREFTK